MWPIELILISLVHGSISNCQVDTLSPTFDTFVLCSSIEREGVAKI